MVDPTPVVGEDTTLEGLAQDWESDSKIRRAVLKGGNLLTWPNPKSVGVISFPAVRLNRKVLEYVLLHWCPQATDRKTASIGFLKPQAGRGGVEAKS